MGNKLVITVVSIIGIVSLLLPSTLIAVAPTVTVETSTRLDTMQPLKPVFPKMSLGGGSGTIGTIRVNSVDRDSSQVEADGTYDHNIASLSMGRRASGDALNAAFVFQGITIPADCTILSAKITFTASSTITSTTGALTIKGEDTATPADYGAAEDFTARTYTTASVSWTPASTWTAESTYDTADITSIVAELYASYTPYSTEDMAFEVLGLAGSAALTRKVAYSYDGSAAKAPLLVITYSPNDAYWVGASGTWSDATNHWATSSGGAPGAANLPSHATNVHFDANSGFVGGNKTVTIGAIAYCADMDWTAAPNTPILAQGTQTLQINGDLTLITGITWTSASSTTYFLSTGTNTITTNGVTIADAIGAELKFGDPTATGKYTLQDNFTTGGEIVVQGGELDTNNKTIICNSISLDYAGANHTLTLGSSTVTLTGTTALDADPATNLILNEGTSTIILSGSNSRFLGGGETYYNVQLTGTGTAVYMTGANTFTNLTRTGTAVKTDEFVLYANQTITGTLTLNGNSATNRLLVNSDTPGTYRTLTAAAVSASNVDFLDIQGAGAASWDLSAITGGSGNVGHNAGITFTPADDSFWVDDTGSWSDITHWASTSGGVAGSQRVPLVQDTAYFDANSIAIDSRVINMDMPRIGNIDMTGVERYPQFDGNGSGGGTVNLWGDVILGDVNWTPATTNFYGRGTQEIWSNGEQFDSAVNLYNYGAVWHIEDDFIATGTVTLLAGTINMQGLQLTCNSFVSTTTTYARSIAWQGGEFYLTYASPAWNVVATNLTIGTNTGDIVFNPVSGNATFTSGSFTTYNEITLQGATNYSTTVSGAFTTNIFRIDRSEAAKTLSGNITITLNTALDIPVNGVTVVTITNTDFSKAAGVVATDYIAFSGGANTSTAAGGATFFAGTHSTGSPQTGWSFTDPTNPTLTLTDATDPALTSITLNGTVDTMGSFTPLYLFWQYGVTATYDGSWITTTETTVIGVGSYSLGIIGINPDTEYNVRMVVRYNVSSYTYTAYGTFESSGKPTVETGTATVDVPALSASLNGTITSLGIYANVVMYFEYGKTLSYEKGVTTQQYSAQAPLGFADEVAGLLENTTYHYRAVVLYNGTEKVYGLDATFTTNIAAATTLPTDIQAHLIVVDRNLLTDSLVTYDRIYLVQYDLIYDANPTDYTARESYIFQLLDTSGNLLGSQLCYPYFNKGYGQGVVAFYFPAAGAPAWLGAYTVRITGNPTIFTGTLPSKDFVLDSTNYTTLSAHADTQAFLCTTIISIAEDLEQEWQTTLLSQEDPGTVLNATGEAYFRSAIPNIQSLAPCLFYIQDVSVDTSKRSWGTSLGDTYKTRLDGTFIKDGLEGAADLINVPLVLLYGVICLAVCVWLIYQSQKKFQTAVPGYIGSLMVILCAGILVLGFTLISIVALVLVIAAGWLLFMRRA